MNDTSNDSNLIDRPSSGIDRRSALKRVAVGGAIAWTAPALMSSSVSAVQLFDGCTAKCGAVGSATIRGSASIQACLEGIEPGQQGLRAILNNDAMVTSGASCGCGETEVAIIAPVPGTETIDVARPGNDLRETALEFLIEIEITCTDRAGNTLISSCTGTGRVICPGPGQNLGDCSGNCNSQVGKTFTWEATVPCALSDCILAVTPV